MNVCQMFVFFGDSVAEVVESLVQVVLEVDVKAD